MMTSLLVGVTLAMGQVEAGARSAETNPVAGAVETGSPAPPAFLVPMPYSALAAATQDAREAPTLFTLPPPGLSSASPEQAAASGALYAAATPPRRAMPSPFDSPPLPGSEYQGYPIIGVPYDTTVWPLIQAIQGTWYSDALNGVANSATNRD